MSGYGVSHFIKECGGEGRAVVVCPTREWALERLHEAVSYLEPLGVVVGVEKRPSQVLRIVLPRGVVEFRAYRDYEDLISRACGMLWRWIGLNHPAVSDEMEQYLLTRCRGDSGQECWFDGRSMSEIAKAWGAKIEL